MKFIIMPNITVELAELSYKLFKISIIIMSLLMSNVICIISLSHLHDINSIASLSKIN